MIYDYVCDTCSVIFEAQVPMKDRALPQPCACGGIAHRDVMSSMRNSRVAYQEDLYSMMDRKMRNNPNWTPPKPHGGTSRGGGGPGAGRHYLGDPRHSKKWE